MLATGEEGNDGVLRCFSCSQDKTGLLHEMEIGKPKKTKVIYKIKEELVGSVQHPVNDLLVLATKKGAWSFVDLNEMKEVLRVSPFSDKKIGFSYSASSSITTTSTTLVIMLLDVSLFTQMENT